MKTRGRRIALLALAIPVLLLIAVASPAKAASIPAGTYQLHNIYYSQCLTEDGDTGAIYLQACGTGSNINHSQLWKFTAFGQLVNDHSGLCLIVTGYDAGVWLTGGTACTTSPISVAEWYPTAETDGEIANGHTQYFLDANTKTGAITQEPGTPGGTFWSMVPGT